MLRAEIKSCYVSNRVNSLNIPYDVWVLIVQLNDFLQALEILAKETCPYFFILNRTQVDQALIYGLKIIINNSYNIYPRK